jgi:uncharacterized protein YndB with AHSA1/START domain
MTSETDRIERQIVVKAPRSRVWRAIANAEELGSWFGVDFTGKQFVVGEWTIGRVTYPGYEHLDMGVLVERIEPERYLAWRWHPYAVDLSVDFSGEPTTLCEFELADVDGGTLVQVRESGFDQVPVERRDEAFRMNSDGWDEQVLNIARHVDGA